MSIRYAIVNADDFGRSPGINRGVSQAYEQGILTSASLMVRWPAAAEAASYAAANPGLSIGLHIDLGEWVYQDGKWVPVYQVVDVGDACAVSREMARQLGVFERLMGRPPTHIDSHQHAHVNEPVRTLAVETAQRLKVPVRHMTPSVKYCGRFYGQNDRSQPCRENIRVAGFLGILAGLEPGVTEIGCHPAASTDLDTTYRSERLIELRTLCDLRVRHALSDVGVELCSYLDWRPNAVSKS